MLVVPVSFGFYFTCLAFGGLVVFLWWLITLPSKIGRDARIRRNAGPSPSREEIRRRMNAYYHGTGS